uniref:Protein kinase domain-containing protein n=2 Tax=Kalanchoe fedtschenkoi TaxID=63787 RepID=A0A7N0TA16_KALFE
MRMFRLLPVLVLSLCALLAASQPTFLNAVSVSGRIGRSPISLPAPTLSPAAAPMSAYPPGVHMRSYLGHRVFQKNMLIPVIVASSAFFAAILSLCVWFYHRSHSHRSMKKRPHTSDSEKGLGLGPILSKLNSSFRVVGKKGSVALMDFKLLEKGTNKFSENEVLGVGGFGCVYKAKLDDNLYVAVKKINAEGSDAEREFQNEVNLLSRIQHPNIISLLGYCTHEEARLLVYELMGNGSLETQLHGPSHGAALSWHTRMKIALDTARGLEYLHENCNPAVIHRDLKTSNILLDPNFNAKISDFGLAVTEGSHNKNIKLSGTLGYVAPEYLLDGKLTDKSDVYAFGVVLLELLLGRKPVEKLAPSQCQSIVTWAMPQLTDRSKLPNIVDPVIKDTMDLKHLYQVAAVAVLCVQPEPSYRPLITDVLHSLIPLVPVELGGTLRVNPQPAPVAPSSAS